MKRLHFVLLLAGAWLLAACVPVWSDEPEKSSKLSQEKRIIVTVTQATGEAKAGAAEEKKPADQQQPPKDDQKKETKGSDTSASQRPFRIQLIQPGTIIVHEQAHKDGKATSEIVSGITVNKDDGAQKVEIRILELPGEGEKTLGGSRQVIQVQTVPGQPARIIIQKDGQTWTVDENHLDKLPDEVRSVYEKYRVLIAQLRKQQSELYEPWRRFPTWLTEQPQAWRERASRGMRQLMAMSSGEDGNISERLERVEKELSEIRKQLDALSQLADEIRALRKLLEKKEE
ncbi:MAG: hypothetical protein KatS3mg110_2032 [Pirellulaceae bacterium]|nr:MAG: hypothetical protein KatS3mg110_2032 [Pirellulaceae bacterium]